MAKTKSNKANSKEAKVLLVEEYNNLLKECNGDFNMAGDKIGEKLKSCKELVYNSIVPNIIEKFASEETKKIWLDIVKNPTMLSELGVFGVSIANTMRPVAGNTFADWVCKTLNHLFIENKLDLRCQTSGKYKKIVNDFLNGTQQVVNTETGEVQTLEQKPDVDIVLYNPKLNDLSSILGIISCKTTLAERVMQTISWQSYISSVLDSQIPVYLMTAWEDFKGESANRERVQSLAGVFVCNESVVEYGKIKKFSSALEEFKKLIK